MSPAIYDHYRPTEADVSPGIYRVVGTGDGVTLLRVGDADGRRVTTGEVTTVEDLSEFEPADNPDGNHSLAATVQSIGRSTYWSLRTFATSLLAHPLPSLAAITLLGAGNLGAGSLPGPVPTVLIIVGAAGLAYIGGGRLDG